MRNPPVPCILAPVENPGREGGAAVDLGNLPDDPDELKRIIFDMQFGVDLKDAVCDILKKTQASTQGRSRTGRRAFWWTPWRRGGRIRLD